MADEPVLSVSGLATSVFSADAEMQFAKPTSIIFNMDNVEVLRITKDRIIGNPDVPADDAATAILRALEAQIRALK